MSGKPESRPARSNSLQRMLELERQCMVQRLQANSTISNGPASTPASPVVLNQPSKQSAGTQDRRHAALAARNYRTGPSSTMRSGTGAPQLPQLTPLVMDFDSEAPSSSGTATPTRKCAMTPKDGNKPSAGTKKDKENPKVVAFQFPPSTDDRRSLCQSPTWESHGYGQRKKGKERDSSKQSDPKDDKKTTTQAGKDAPKAKKTRLSKPPPPASSSSSSRIGIQSNRSDTTIASSASRPGPFRERPASALEILAGIDLAPPPKHNRRRSGSFSSLIKAFDVRRSSEASTEAGGGFIGGIKLEEQRFISQQTTLDGKTKLGEKDIHPVFRGTSAGPSKAPARESMQRQGGLVDSATNRAYPPIAMQTTSNRTRSLLPPAARATSELSTIEKWRTRMTQKLSHSPEKKRDEHARDGQNTGVKKGMGREQTQGGMASPTAQKQTAAHGTAPRRRVGRQVPGDKEKSQSNIRGRIHHTVPSQNPMSESLPELQRPLARSSHSATGQFDDKESRQDSSSSGTSGQGGQTSSGFYSAPTTPPSPPPAPPRRSSKRNSTYSLNGLQNGLANGHHLPVRPVAPPSAETSKRHAQRGDGVGVTPWTEGSRDHFDMPDVKPLVTQAPLAEEVATASDTSSDYFHSPSLQSTPDTSHPQSENAGTPILADIESFQLDAHPWKAPKPQEDDAAVARQKSDEHREYPRNATNLDPIEEAARKVMAAFPDMPVRHGTIDRRRSRSDIVVEASATTTVKRGGQPGHSNAVDTSRARQSEVSLVPTQSALKAKSTTDDAPGPHAASRPRGLRATGDTHPAVSPTAPPPLDVAAPVAKIFVECCGCKYYHDLPSKLYEAMANPEGLVTPGSTMEFAGAISMTVRCPWCQHEMSTKCCAGFAAMVYVKERLH